MYFDGDSVRKEKSKAKELFGKACDGGNSAGCKSYRVLNKEGI